MSGKKYDSLESEISDLRKKAAVNEKISDFAAEVYGLQNEKEIFAILKKYLHELTAFERFAFLSFCDENVELKIEYSKGFENENDKVFPLDVLNEETTFVKDGFSQKDELSLRLNMDFYAAIPMLFYAKENEIAFWENIDACVSGIFVFDCAKMSDLKVSENVLVCEKIIGFAKSAAENVFTLQSIRQEAEKTKKELQHARIVQEKLLPEKISCGNLLQSAAFYAPLDEVGGDYYDLFALEDGVYALIIADVSGHGVSAALVMSVMKILLKSNASANLSPAKTLNKINELFVRHIPANRFVTAFYAIIDTNRKKLTYTCAGHCPILLFNKESKKYKQFQSDGFFVGMFAGLDLPDHEYTYQAGNNRLLLYTDGVVDCSNDKKTQYGLIRLETVITNTLENSVEKAVNETMDDIRNFIKNGKANDDITLFVVDF